MHGWRHWLPGSKRCSRYEGLGCANDVVAGLVLTTMLVPVGVAYAEASGVPDLWALRHNRPTAGLCAVRTQSHFGAGSRPRSQPSFSPLSCRSRVAIRCAPLLLASCWRYRFGSRMHHGRCSAPGLRHGTSSKPIRYGYMNGIALTVLISQLPKLLGFSVDAEVAAAGNLGAIAQAVSDRKANWTTFMVGAATLATILLLKGSKRLAGIFDRGHRRDRCGCRL